MAASGNPYLGSKVSLISKSEIRYEGTLYAIDAKEATLALAKVRSFGTENRPTDRPIAPGGQTYEFVIFSGNDIKDIFLGKPPRLPQTMAGGLPKDPAILQHSGKGIPVAEQNQAKVAPRQNRGGRKGQNQPRQPAAAAAQTGMSHVMAMFRGGAQHQQPKAKPASKPKPKGQAENGEPGFHAATSGRGGRNQPRGGQTRGGSARGRGRGGRRPRSSNPPSTTEPGRPAKPKTTVKFETEFDFEQAIVEFKDMIDEFEKTALEDKDAQVADVGPQAGGDAEPKAVNAKAPEGPFYDKTKSFFDNISCQATEKLLQQQMDPKPRNQYWKAARKLNMETFGSAGRRFFGRGGRGFRRAPGDAKKAGEDAGSLQPGEVKQGRNGPKEGQKKPQRRGPRGRGGSRQKRSGEKTDAPVAV